MIVFPELKTIAKSADSFLPVSSIKEDFSSKQVTQETSNFQNLLKEVQPESSSRKESEWKTNESVVFEKSDVPLENRVAEVERTSEEVGMEEELVSQNSEEDIIAEECEEETEISVSYLLDRLIQVSERKVDLEMENSEEIDVFEDSESDEVRQDTFSSSIFSEDEEVNPNPKLSISQSKLELEKPSENPKEIVYNTKESKKIENTPQTSFSKEMKMSMSVDKISEKSEIILESEGLPKKVSKNKEAKLSFGHLEAKENLSKENSSLVVNLKEILGDSVKVQKISKKEDYSAYENQKLEISRQRELQNIAKNPITLENSLNNGNSPSMNGEGKNSNENFFTNLFKETLRLNIKSNTTKAEGLQRSETFYKNLQEIIKSANFHIIENGRNSARIELNPRELGKMTLRVMVENDRLEGKILVETEAAKALVQSDISTLRDELKNIGLELQTLTIDLDSADSNPFRFAENEDDSTNVSSSLRGIDSDEVIEEEEAYQKDPTKLVDIRV